MGEGSSTVRVLREHQDRKFFDDIEEVIEKKVRLEQLKKISNSEGD